LAARSGGGAGDLGRTQPDAEGPEATSIRAEERIVTGACAQARQIRGQGRGRRVRETVDAATAGPGDHHEAVAAQIGEVL
jgi:hypothetical protein